MDGIYADLWRIASDLLHWINGREEEKWDE